VGRLSVRGAGLVDFGIPKESVLAYDSEIRAGNLVLLAHGPVERTGASKLCWRQPNMWE
jgi:hypothetical protein